MENKFRNSVRSPESYPVTEVAAGFLEAHFIYTFLNYRDKNFLNFLIT